MIRFLLVGSVLAACAPLAAQGGQAPVAERHVDADAQRLFREVMSPFCPGLTLADCPSPNAFTMRDEIEARLGKGESREAILDEMVAKYGATILADPSDTPIGAVVWGVPIAISAAAALGLAVFLRRASREREDGEPAAAAGPAGLRERLDRELEDLD